MEIPRLLIDDIRSGNIVLFLGAGASVGATSRNGEKIPIGKALGQKLVEKFLDPSYADNDLSYISEIAISQKGLYEVQSFIKEIFDNFRPGVHQLLIPTFNWKAIFTTNYDLLIEQAYDEKLAAKEAQQIVNPIYRNSRQQEVFKPGHLPYFKLHGSFHVINDEKLPLILTPDQYINHQIGRERVFDHLHDYASSYSFLFVGFSFADTDIRAILNKIGSYETRTRSYMIGPYIRPAEASLWEGKKITSLITTFEDFLKELDKKIPQSLRSIVSKLPSYEQPIFSQFTISVADKKPSDSFLEFLENDVDYVHSALPAPNTDPKAFYKGYFTNWDPIIRNLDVNRSIKDGIISEVFLIDEEPGQRLYVIKGHAGSGKSVLLKRLAWEASVSFGMFCIFLKPNSHISYEPLYELYSFVKRRIFLFIDQASKNLSSIERVLDKAQKDNIPITILTSERINVWNIECDSIEKYVEDSFHLKYLNDKEIRELIALLERYDSLGYLKGKSAEEQNRSFKEKSEKELLVALHESTHGKPFYEIIEDEYNSIGDEAAKSLYLTVCILHRLGTYVRAGLISRVHGIGFEEFKQRLFKPLELVVFNDYDSRINDYVYTSRHPQIAEMIFELILKGKQDKYDEYVRIISNLNTDYDSDRTGYIAMTNATSLLSLFDDPVQIRNLFKIAEEKNPNDPKLFQQQAIFEMKRPNGNLNIAEEFLHKAYDENPNDIIIAHSFAEFELKKAEKATHKLEIFKNIDNCKQICIKLIKKQKNARPYTTLIKGELLRLEYVAKNPDGPTIERIVKEIEKYLSEAKQLFPDEVFLLEVESQFNELIERNVQAQEALEKAFQLNPSSPFICLRLANFYESKGKLDKAIAACKETLKTNSIDRDVNFKLGMLLSKELQPNYGDILHFFRKSFTKGDARYLAQMWYARTCFITRDFATANEIFEHTGRARVAPEVKYKPRGIMKNGNGELSFNGTVVRKEITHAIIRRDDFGDMIYCNRIFEEKNWEKFDSYNRVSFKLAFNYKGALAIEVKKIEKKL